MRTFLIAATIPATIAAYLFVSAVAASVITHLMKEEDE